MSERYLNNLTGDFSICFSEHLTEHPIYYHFHGSLDDGKVKQHFYQYLVHQKVLSARFH